MISVHSLSLSFGDKVVLDRFSLTLPHVPLLGITGPSGCGKTTLLRVLAGLERPQSGSVSGISPQRTAFLFQENRLLPWRTAGQNITDVLPSEWAKVIMSATEEECVANFNAMKDKLHQLGLDQLVAAQQAAYSANVAKFNGEF